MKGIGTCAALLVLGWLVLGCTSELPPTGQVLLFVTTDAPLPSSLDGAPGLFDRLRIDIYPSGADEPCTGCTRAFPVERDEVDRGDASVGIAPEPNESGARARVRLYRSGGTISGEPRPGSTLEAVVAIPEVGDEGVVEVTVTLLTDSVGAPVGSLARPVTPEPGRPAAGLVGTWPGAETVACTTAPAADQVCVPGGAFWMGDPRLDLSAVEDIDGALERLVVLSPFLLDRTEVTVAAFRGSGLAYPLVPGGPSDNPHEADTGIEGCTYTSAPGENDGRPTSCVSWDLASQYCASVGKVLPTEAQLEMAESNGGLSTFPWGEDAPRCEDAVFAREDECASLGGGAAVVGSGARDRVRFGEGEAVDLAGNVSEWARDAWNREDEPCWGTGLFVDPVCEAWSLVDPMGRTIRGGHYEALELDLRAAVRTRVFNDMLAVSGLVGFRCAGF